MKALLFAAALGLAALTGTAASAADFLSVCHDFIVKAAEGQASPKIDKVCTCVKAKLTETDQSAVASELQRYLDETKAGKEPLEPTADKKTALEKFTQTGETCTNN